jgi:hypothetical protein
MRWWPDRAARAHRIQWQVNGGVSKGVDQRIHRSVLGRADLLGHRACGGVHDVTCADPVSRSVIGTRRRDRDAATFDSLHSAQCCPVMINFGIPGSSDVPNP